MLSTPPTLNLQSLHIFTCGAACGAGRSISRAFHQDQDLTKIKILPTETKAYVFNVVRAWKRSFELWF